MRTVHRSRKKKMMMTKEEEGRAMASRGREGFFRLRRLCLFTLRGCARR